jgi:replication factor C small subunit
MTKLWTEQYRPKTLDEFVWRDANQRQQVEEWINNGSLPHLLLSGVQGTGKTSLAKLMFRQLGVQNGDILELNASRERNPDVIASKVLNFCTTWALGDMKYVLLDEADSMTPLAQRILRGEMENYHESVRFILTCNYPNKIIPALHSRCQGFHFEALDVNEFTSRIADIVIQEGVQLETEADVEVLHEFVELTYPDLRKCINMLQQHVRGGKLERPQQKDTGGKDYMNEMVALFMAGQYTEARKLVVATAQPEEYSEIYRFMYQNLGVFGETEAQQNEALLLIRKGLVNHALVADIEINLAATLCELSALRAG